MAAPNQPTDDLEFLRQVLRDLTHEVAAPLTPLFGHLDLLEIRGREELTPLQERCVKAMRRSLKRLTAINDRMLELARLERGHIPCQPAPLDPVEALETAARSQADAAEAAEVTLTVRAECGDRQALADWNLLQLALGHLLENALRFAPAGSEVELGAALEGQRCVFRVVDRGAGVPQEERERVVQPFYRLTPEDAYTETAGLGLTIVTLILRRLSGQLTLQATDSAADAPGLTARLDVPQA